MFKVLNKLKVLDNLKEEWRMKTPKQKWIFIYNIPAKLGELIGVRVLTDLKVFWYSYICLAAGFVQFSTVAYTVWIYYQRGRFLEGLQCTSTLGIVISVNESLEFM